MENSVTIKITRKGYEIKAIVDDKKYIQKWINTLTGATTVRNDFKYIKDKDVADALDLIGGGDLYDIMRAL